MKASGSESSISEACDESKASQLSDPKEHPIQESSNEKDDDRSKSAVRKEVLEIPKTNIMNKRGSLTSAKSLHEFKRGPLIDETTSTLDTDGSNDGKNKGNEASTSSTKGIRPSKSENSIIDSFVVVEGTEYGKKKSPNALRAGIFSFQNEIFDVPIHSSVIVFRVYVATTVGIPIQINNAYCI